jgi:hypothetical protein
VNNLANFVQRYPHGTDLPLPEVKTTKPLRHFIPAQYEHALWLEALLELAKAQGYSDEDIQVMRKCFYAPVEPTLVSLDDIYGEEVES